MQSDKHQTCGGGEARQQWVEGVEVERVEVVMVVEVVVMVVMVEVQKMNYWVH